MPDARKKEIDDLIGGSLLGAEVLASEVRRQLVEAVAARPELSVGRQLEIARLVLSEAQPVLEAAMIDAEVAAWVSGVLSVEKKLPETLKAVAGLDKITYPVDILDAEVIRFPIIEEAKKSLLEREVVLRPVFDQMELEARRKAFTVATIDTTEVIGDIRNVLVETVDEGASLGGFKRRLEEKLEAGRLGPAHVENVYRTNIQSAFHDGMDELASDPTVEEIFPYAEYLAVHDGRAEDTHLALETLGLSGTGIYRVEDPFWQVFKLPWRYQCRCGKNFLTIEAAARKGVVEAQKWLRTGIKPPLESRLPSIPFRPEPEFS